MSKDFYLQVGNDNGNSEQDIIINGEFISSPNVYSKVLKLPNLEEFSPKYVAENIHENLIVTVTSTSVNNGTPTTYYIGEYATRAGSILKNIKVGAMNSKVDSDVPVINTLSHIAAYVVQQAFKQNLKEESFKANVDMTTGLPVNQYNKEAAKAFAEKFLNHEHKVVVYLGSEKREVSINFEYVKTLPEGVPTVFFLESLKEGSEAYKVLLGDVIGKLKEKGVSFENIRIFHTAIGEGTTEHPLTEGYTFDPNFINGTDNGTGHAINEVLNMFRKDMALTKFERQDYSMALRDEDNRFHNQAVEYIQIALEQQADIILDNLKREVGRANNNGDLILIYGGGSILMEKYLKDEAEKFSKKVNIPLLYVPKEYAVRLEVEGMYVFTTQSNIFKSLKEKYQESRKE